jgi:hypothetical protein
VLLMVEATDFLCLSETQMFTLPSLIAITIAATRLYRSLAHFASPPTYDILPSSPSSRSLLSISLTHCSAQDSETPQSQRSNRLVSNAIPSIVQMPSNRLEVTVHTAYEEYPMSQIDDKPHKINFDDDVEGREGNKMSLPVEAAV